MLGKLAPAVWQFTLNQHYQIPADYPEWLTRTTMRREAVSAPHVWSAFAGFNKGTPYAEWIKPFSFMMSPNTGRWRFHQPVKFVAPDDRNPNNWNQHQYTEIHTQHSTVGRLLVQLAQLETSIDQWRQNPEIVANAPDGRPCQRDTTGLLDRRTITSAQGLVTLIGKEAGSVETEDQLAEDHASAHLATYQHPQHPWSIAKEAIKKLGVTAVARASGTITPRGLRNALRSDVQPRVITKQRLVQVAAAMIQKQLGIKSNDDMAVIAAYLVGLTAD